MIILNKERARLVDEAEAYLRNGGICEVIGLADMAFELGSLKVQMDTCMAMAIAILAADRISCMRCGQRRGDA